MDDFGGAHRDAERCRWPSGWNNSDANPNNGRCLGLPEHHGRSIDGLYLHLLCAEQRRDSRAVQRLRRVARGKHLCRDDLLAVYQRLNVDARHSLIHDASWLRVSQRLPDPMSILFIPAGITHDVSVVPSDPFTAEMDEFVAY